MKNFVKNIPGFRTLKVWKIVLASLYYLLCIMVLFIVPILGLLMFGMPFLFVWVLKRQSVKSAGKGSDYQQYVANFERYKDTIYVISESPQIQNVWSKWSISDHDSKDQYFRRRRAAETIPICIDMDTLSGKFLGHTEEIYDASLITCDCPDFTERRLPCKHMYRLYRDLDQNNLLDINDGLARAKEITEIRKFAHTTKLLFVDIVQRVKSHGVACCHICSDLELLISAGLVVVNENKNYKALLEQNSKDNLLLSLTKKSIQGFKPSWSKTKLVEWILDTQPDFLVKHFKNDVTLSLGDNSLSYEVLIDMVINQE